MRARNYRAYSDEYMWLLRYKGMTREAATKELERIQKTPVHLTRHRTASILALQEVLIRLMAQA